MNLTKLLRKHSRTLLMVFMALLLVAFLIPQQISGCGEQQRVNVPQGKAFGGRTVSLGDVERVRTEILLLQQVGIGTPFGSEDALSYYLVSEEARRLGLRVGRNEVKEVFSRSPSGAVVLERLQQTSHRSYDEIFDMIGRAWSVGRLLALQTTGVVASLPRQQLAYRNKAQEAVAEVSVIDAQAFVRSVPEPTDAELQAFFDECKARTPAHTEQELVFGYRLPDRVAVEYLTVSPDKVRPKIRVRASQVRKHFEDYAAQYTKPDPTASQPVQGQPVMVPMTFEEAEEQVREDVREQLAVEEAQRIINDIYAEAHRPWEASRPDDNGFRPTPEGELESFEALQERFSTVYEVEYRRIELTDMAGLQGDSGFAQAMVGDGSRQATVTAPQLAFRVQGIIEKDPGDRLPVINLMEPSPVLMSRRFDPRARRFSATEAYLFRVTAVAPNAPRESLDDIRDKVVEDWKLTKAVAIAGEWAEKLTARAREVGLTAAVAEATELKDALTTAAQAATQPADPPQPMPHWAENLGPFRPRNLTRESPRVDRVGFTRSVAPAIFALGAAGPATTAPTHRVAALPLLNQFRWVVGELIEIKPLYEGPFEAELAKTLAEAEQAERERVSQAWGARENVQQRTGFEPAFGRAPETPEPSGP